MKPERQRLAAPECPRGARRGICRKRTRRHAISRRPMLEHQGFHTTEASDARDSRVRPGRTMPNRCGSGSPTGSMLLVIGQPSVGVPCSGVPASDREHSRLRCRTRAGSRQRDAGFHRDAASPLQQSALNPWNALSDYRRSARERHCLGRDRFEGRDFPSL